MNAQLKTARARGKAIAFISEMSEADLKNPQARKAIRAKKFKSIPPVLWGKLCRAAMEERGFAPKVASAGKRRGKGRKAKAQPVGPPQENQSLYMRAKAVGENGRLLQTIQAIENVIAAKENFAALQAIDS
jgi:hypothetical protein